MAITVGVLALGINSLVPPLSALLMAILMGMLTANTVGVPSVAVSGLAVAGKRLLRIGIVLLGLQLSLTDIAGLGAGVIAVLVTVVAGGLAGTLLIGHTLRVPMPQRLLIGAGFSICGAAAVAALDGVVDGADEEDVATAIALVVLFGSVMIAVVPLLGTALELAERTSGLWAGASIHEVAQVVAAAGIIGPTALKVGVVVKLARVLMLAPVIAGLGIARRRLATSRVRSSTSHDEVHAAGRAPAAARRPPIMPLFVSGFLAMVVLRTTGVLPAQVLDDLKLLQTALLSAAMFALGTGVRLAKLRAVGIRPVLLGVSSTALVTVIGLGGAVLAA